MYCSKDIKIAYVVLKMFKYWLVPYSTEFIQMYILYIVRMKTSVLGKMVKTPKVYLMLRVEPMINLE